MAVRLVHHKISEATMATSAPEGEGPPLDAEVMGKFQEMFADLLLEAKEGRLSQEELVQAATRRMEAHGDAIRAGPHCSAEARRLLSVETDDCVAVLLKDGLSDPPERIPDISEATFAALNAVLSGKPSSPEQRAKWPRGLGDVLDGSRRDREGAQRRQGHEGVLPRVRVGGGRPRVGLEDELRGFHG